MGTAKEDAEAWIKAQPDKHNYQVDGGTYHQLTDLPDAVWVFMNEGKGNINLGNNSKYASDDTRIYEVRDDPLSAEGGVSLVYVRKVNKA